MSTTEDSNTPSMTERIAAAEVERADNRPFVETRFGQMRRQTSHPTKTHAYAQNAIDAIEAQEAARRVPEYGIELARRGVSTKTQATTADALRRLIGELGYDATINSEAEPDVDLNDEDAMVNFILRHRSAR